MSVDMMGDWVPEYHEYPIKVDYFNRVRVFVTQVIPDMVADEAVPAWFQLKYVLKTYRKFETIGRTRDFQAADTLKVYHARYISNLHLLIEKYLKEVEQDELDRRDKRTE